MRYLILVRHSISQVQPGTSAHTWALAETGAQRCDALARRLRGYDITTYASSDEPKAIQTAQHVADRLGHRAPPIIDPPLRETARATVPYFDDPETFRLAIRQAMAAPDQRLFGEETFADAVARLSAGISDLTASAQAGSIALVSHGTVMSLYIAQQTGLDAFSVWSLLGMPAFAVFRLPDMAICELCFSVDAP